jgi:hypothetical protein
MLGFLLANRSGDERADDGVGALERSSDVFYRVKKAIQSESITSFELSLIEESCELKEPDRVTGSCFSTSFAATLVDCILKTGSLSVIVPLNDPHKGYNPFKWTVLKRFTFKKGRREDCFRGCGYGRTLNLIGTGTGSRLPGAKKQRFDF